MEARRAPYEVDLRLARDVVSGSIEAWHDFVYRYSSLIFSIVHQYMMGGDEDDERDAYAGILEHLYRHGLSRYDGRAALSTWIIAVSRSRCLDLLRSRRGRKRLPAWLARLSKCDQEIYRRYCIESESYSSIAADFRRRGQALTAEEFERALDRIDARMLPKLQVRMAYDLQAKSVGAVSGRLLELLDHLRIEQEAIAETQQPDFELLQAQTRILLGRIRECVERLDTQEQQVVELHYYRHLTATRIAAELDLPAPRRVYTLLDRALATLRLMLRDTTGPRDGISAAAGPDARDVASGGVP